MLDFSQIFTSLNFAEYSPIIIVFFLVLFTFVSEDLACVTAGALVSQGSISFSLAVLGCLTGIFVGDVLLYWTGRIFGRNIINNKIFARFVSPNSFSKASDWLERRGAEAIFLSRLITGLRLPTYLAAGILQTNFAKFSFYFLIAAAIWTPLIVGFSAYSVSIFPSQILLAVFIIFVLIRVGLHFSSWKNRRLFIGRLTRWRNWEFWSLQIFYFPVVLYVFFLAIKHRSLTVFTCANPAIQAGGFVGESKDGIYQGLMNSSATKSYLLPHVFLSAQLSPENNLRLAESFIEQNRLDFPMIFKPNAGERGKDVSILRDSDELKKQILNLESDFLLQEFFAGDEASVFYYRYPNQEKGKIFSITEKTFPALRGDGESSLETLILRDKRAVALAQKYFEQNSERLDYVAAADETIQIINIGTHSRGAIFSDGEHLKTTALEEKIDEICREFEGFYFGRFDIRCQSFEALKRGENFKVIELNGVTSESTNIYDKKFTLFDAYRILFRQWAIAFKIG